MTNEELVKIFTKFFYISFNNSDSDIRKLVEDSIDEESNTINLLKMVESKELLKDSNPLLYNFLSNKDVIQNAEYFIELFKKTNDYEYGYPQIFLEQFVDNNFIQGFHEKIDSKYLERNEKCTNPVYKKREKFNLVKDFLCSNNTWGRVDFSNLSLRNEERSGFNPLSIESSYRFYAKATYSKIAIGYKEFTEQVKEIVEKKINKNWQAKINKRNPLNPYYVLDYGTESLVHTLFKEKYWNVYIKAEEEYSKVIQKNVELPCNLRCALANLELALETINYVLQKDANCSYEPHLYSEIEKNLKSEWNNEPHVKNMMDLIHYEEWGTVYPISKSKVKSLREALIHLSDDLKKEYNIENDKLYSVYDTVKFLKKIYIKQRKQRFDDYEKIQDIIWEFEGKVETSGGQNSLNKEIDEEGAAIGNFISDLDISDRYNIKNDSNKILSKLIRSYDKTVTKINTFFMFDSGYKAFLIQYLKKFGLEYFVHESSSRLELNEDSYDSQNRKNTKNKMFFCWKRILKTTISRIYETNPGILLNCFDDSSNNKLENNENFDEFYSQIKVLNLNEIEDNIICGKKLTKDTYTSIFNKWMESISADIQKYFKNNPASLDSVFDILPGEIKTSTKYIKSIKAINLYELKKIISIDDPFITLIKTKNEFLDFDTIILEIEKAVNDGLFEEQTFYTVAFEALKTGNKEKPAGDVWSNAWTQYKSLDGKLYNELEFRKVMNLIIDLETIIERKNIKGQNVYSELEQLINTEKKSKFMHDLRMLLSGVENFYDSDTELEKIYSTVLGVMKKLGYTYVLKYDDELIEEDIEIMSYDYETSLKKIINA